MGAGVVAEHFGPCPEMTRDGGEEGPHGGRTGHHLLLPDSLKKAFCLPMATPLNFRHLYYFWVRRQGRRITDCP